MSVEKTTFKNTYKVSFNYRYGRVRIYKKVIQALGTPKYIQFIISPKDKVFFICGLDHRERDCFPVEVDLNLQAQGMVLFGQRFTKRVCEIAGWDLDGTHTVSGVFIQERNIFRFSLLDER